MKAMFDSIQAIQEELKRERERERETKGIVQF